MWKHKQKEKNHWALDGKTGASVDSYEYDLLSDEELDKVRCSTKFICPGCGVEVFLRRLESHVYVYGRHKDGCDYDKGKFNLAVHLGDKIFEIEKIIDYEDKDDYEEDKPKTKGNPQDETNGLEIPAKPDFDFKAVKIRSLPTLTKTALAMNLSERINGTIKLDDFLVCKDNIDKKRNEDLADTRLVIAKRIPIKKDSPVYPYKKSGYLYFVDEVSNKDTDPHNSVFFFVKVANRKKYNELQDKIYGEHKDHHSLISLLARWRELNNPDGFHIYYATINSKSYWFFNR